MSSSYPKGKQNSRYRAAERKRKFYGNRYVKKDNKKIAAVSVTDKQSTTSSPQEDMTIDLSHRYRIIEFNTVFNSLADTLCCKSCKQTVKFEDSAHEGFAWKLVVSCRCADRSIDSGPQIDKDSEINRRMVFVTRLLGVNFEGINMFSNLMELSDGFSREAYDGIVECINCLAPKTVQVATDITNQIIDGGYSSILRLMKWSVGLTIGYYSSKYAKKLDEERKEQQEYQELNMCVVKDEWLEEEESSLFRGTAGGQPLEK